MTEGMRWKEAMQTLQKLSSMEQCFTMAEALQYFPSQRKYNHCEII